MTDIFWAELFKFLGIFTGAGFALWGAIKASQAKNIAKETHVAVNSRMDELLKLTKESSKAEGKIEGAAEEKDKHG